MFDGIIKNMLTDAIRGALIAIATYLGVTGDAENQFVAAGLVIFGAVWAWWENRGHQRLVAFIAARGHDVSSVTKGIAK
jgi:hypothetical protein